MWMFDWEEIMQVVKKLFYPDEAASETVDVVVVVVVDDDDEIPSCGSSVSSLKAVESKK